MRPPEALQGAIVICRQLRARLAKDGSNVWTVNCRKARVKQHLARHFRTPVIASEPHVSHCFTILAAETLESKIVGHDVALDFSVTNLLSPKKGLGTLRI